jgi:organic radical activating enzyme
MLEMKKTLKKIDFATAVIDATYRCNDNCEFCFNKKLLNKAPQLSPREIYEKYELARKKWGIRQVILSGGEPTLHPDFFEIMDFFLNSTKTRISLNTNGLRFIDKNFAKRLGNLLQNAKNKKHMFSLSLSNVNSFPAKTTKEGLKLAGIEKAIHIANASESKVVVVISVTKQNFKILPKLTSFLARKMKQGGVISIRGLYLDKAMSALQKSKTVPKKFEEIRQPVEKAILNSLKNPKIKIRLFNLPLCYFQNSKILDAVIPNLKKWHHEVRVKISKGKKMVGSEFRGELWSKKTCKHCLFDSICNKIQNEFIEKFDYPSLLKF